MGPRRRPTDHTIREKRVKAGTRHGGCRTVNEPTAVRPSERRETAAVRYFRVLFEAGRLFAESFELQHTLDALVQLTVPELAEAVAINIVDDDGVTRTAALDVHDPAHRPLLEQLRDAYVVERDPDADRACSPRRRVSRARRGKLDRARPLAGARRAGLPYEPRRTARSHGVLRGDLVCHWSHKTRDFDAFALALFEELARRAAVAIENAQMYRREKRIADEVQKALLPVALPDVAGYAFDAVYSSSERDVEVGGDWFDAFVLPDGRVVVSIGDVFGRGLHAAVAMASIRHGLRVLALQQSQPDSMLAVIDEALARDYPDAAASAVVGVLDPAAQTLTYAIAGHHSPLLRTADGEVIALRGVGYLSACAARSKRTCRPSRCRSARRCVFFTDGLIESDNDVTRGEERLHAALRNGIIANAARPADAIKRHMLARGSNDDVAVLDHCRARCDPPAPAGGADAGVGVSCRRRALRRRRARGFIAFLRTRGVPDANYAAAELVFGD